jgi:hypothetical protein
MFVVVGVRLLTFFTSQLSPHKILQKKSNSFEPINVPAFGLWLRVVIANLAVDQVTSVFY